ncbi:MAG: fluoride efflux transporter FluC [Microbacteriaceae bacterium]
MKGTCITKKLGRWSDILAVACGGCVGTALRFGIDSLAPHTADEFPSSTLLANIVGAFFLGFVVARMWASAPLWLRAGLGAGLLGSFTTFSAVMVSLVSLGSNGEWMLALAYLVATLALGLGAAYFGLRAGRMAGTVAPTPTPPIDRFTE